MRLSLGLIIFGMLGIIISSYVGMDVVTEYPRLPEQNDRLAECSNDADDVQDCQYDIFVIYRYAAFFKDICIVLVLSGIFIEVRDIKKTLRKDKPDEEA